MTVSANTALVQAYALNRARTGWKADEEELLWEEVRKARAEGRALKSVFDIVAKKTGRKPNSIRNYYYARARENPEEAGRHPAFIPFSEEEIWNLLITLLGEQAKGVSVRACTLALGGNDTRAMLRYQNKYRSLIKTNPELVREVVKYMKTNNMPCIDPYEDSPNTKRAGRPRSSSGRIDATQLVQSVIELANLNQKLELALERINNLESSVSQIMDEHVQQNTPTLANLRSS